MAELLQDYDHSVVTSQAPRSNITSAEVAQPYQEIGKAFDKLGGALGDVAVPLAEKAAAEDLMKQKVVIGPDGNPQVLNPANSVMFGDAGREYKRAVASGTVAQVGNVMSQDLTEMHTKFPLDPQGFKTASDAQIQKLSDTAINPVIGQALVREGRQLQTQHLDAITNASAMNDIENQKKSILSNIEDQKNTLIGLARQPGGTYSDAFKQATVRLNDAYDNLGSNKLFKTPQDQIDLEKKNTNALMQGEGVVAQVDETFNKKGKAEAQVELREHVLNNPDLKETDRTRLYAQGMARLGFLTDDARATNEANKEMVSGYEKALADGKIRPNDSTIVGALNQLHSTGDVAGENKLRAAIQMAPHVAATAALPDGARSAALGISSMHYDPTSGSMVYDATGKPPTDEEGGKPGDKVPPPVYDANGNPVPQKVSYKQRVAQIENPSGDPNATSSAGAKGKYQFEPATWAKYGGGGAITGDQEAAMDRLTADNQASLTRTLGRAPTPAELYLAHQQGAGGATELLRNPTARAGDLVGDAAIRQNGGDPNASAATFTNMWIKKFGGGAGPAPPQSANGGPPFTEQQGRENPYLYSAYIRTIANDPESRLEAIKGTVETIKQSINNGILPPPQSVAMVEQAADRDPAKYGFMRDEVRGAMIGAGDGVHLSAPQQAQYKEQVQAWASGGDIHQQALANAALTQMKQQETQAKEHPYENANARGWTPPAPPIDPQAQPADIAQSLAQRAVLSARIGSINRSEPPPLLEKGEQPQLQAALQGQNGAAVLSSIAQSMRPADLQRLVDEPTFRDSITGMSRSGDPVKMTAAYKVMDQLQQTNPLTFDAQFKDGLKDLRAWQSNLAFMTPDAAAKRLQAQYDPNQQAAIEESKKVADKTLENVSASNVVSKFSTGLPLVGATFGLTGTAAQPPVAEMNGLAAGSLKADYDKNYRDGFAATGDGGMADKFAMEKLNLKYAVSPVNGNRVTAFAPERYYPDVGANKDWMATQLDQDIRAVLKVPDAPATALERSQSQGLLGMNEKDLAAFNEYRAPRALVPDQQTEADISAKRPPSYHVVIQQPDGRFSSIAAPDGTPMRFRFDPSRFEADLRDRAEAQRAKDLTAQPVDQLQGLP